VPSPRAIDEETGGLDEPKHQESRAGPPLRERRNGFIRIMVRLGLNLIAFYPSGITGKDAG
jgi:hypothetical protein